MLLRSLALVVGYILGLIQTGYIFGKFKNIDIREYGSGNAGATNTLRVLGAKAGIIVFLGDFLKAFIPCLVFRLIFKDSIQVNSVVLLAYTGLGVVLGHSYPIHMGFRGGKGVASIAGLIGALDWRISIFCLLVFVLTVFFTKYVSLSSILVMVTLIAMTYYLGFRGIFGIQNIMELQILITIIGALSIYRHKQNIIRLIQGKENKITKKK